MDVSSTLLAEEARCEGKTLFARARVDRMLRTLAQRESMTMREFTETARQHARVARDLLDHLIEHDVASETKHRGFGPAGYLEIRITPRGRQVVELLERIHQVVQADDPAGEIPKQGS